MEFSMFNTLDSYLEGLLILFAWNNSADQKAGNPIFDYLVVHIALFYMLGSLMIICVPPKISLRAGPFLLLSIYGGTMLHYENSGASSYSDFAKCLLAGLILNTINIGILRLESPHFSTNTFKEKLVWSIDQYFNTRRIGTPSQLRNLPLFPIQRFAHLSNPDVFVISRILMAWLCYLLWRLLDVLQGYYQESLRAGDYSPDKEKFFRRIGEVTLREIGIRTVLPVLWILPEILSLSAHHYFLSAVSVFIGGDKSISGWNYVVYGSLTESYTVRRYWGIFWQQFSRSGLISWASFISSKILHIPRSSQINEFAMLYLVFFTSAFMHAMVYFPAKIRLPSCGVSHIFQWYFLSPCAIIAEEIVQKLGKAVLNHHGWRTDSRWCYWLGYLWVWGFFAWCLPKNAFPKDDCVP